MKKCPCNGIPGSLSVGAVHTKNCIFSVKYITNDAGIKYDQGKPRMDLLPMDGLLEIAKVLTFGAGKYGDRNWEKGIDPQRLRAAQMRHDAAVEMGEEVDPESGLMHVTHKACDALMELTLRLRNLKK
jgi:hypothetical protein